MNEEPKQLDSFVWDDNHPTLRKRVTKIILSVMFFMQFREGSIHPLKTPSQLCQRKAERMIPQKNNELRVKLLQQMRSHTKCLR